MTNESFCYVLTKNLIMLTKLFVRTTQKFLLITYSNKNFVVLIKKLGYSNQIFR